MAFRLSPEADEDIFAIFEYGWLTYGHAHAEEYVESLRLAFVRLSSNPRLGRELAEVRPPVRMIRHRAHHIFYRLEDHGVLIVRVLHGSRNWPDHMSDDED